MPEIGSLWIWLGKNYEVLEVRPEWLLLLEPGSDRIMIQGLYPLQAPTPLDFNDTYFDDDEADNFEATPTIILAA